MNRVFYTGSMGESGVARSDTRHAGRRGQGWEPWTCLPSLLVHKASADPSHSFPAAGLGNIFGNRKVTAAEICTLPSLIIRIADETFICQGWMFSRISEYVSVV